MKILPSFANEKDEAMLWYRRLTQHQRMGLKVCAKLICGMDWEDFNILFTPRERINILYNKLKLEGII